MSKYLKKFSIHSEYDAYINGSDAILPNVSICTTEGDVHYNPYVPYDPYNGHDHVDLGLPSGTIWATMNIGANDVTDYGNYYMYGKGVDAYSVTSGDSNYNGTENPLAESADTVVQTWGGNWHTPTSLQCKELIDNTTSVWISNYQDSGYNGMLFTATNGNFVFFPAGGRWDNGFDDGNDKGRYWSSTPDGNNGAKDIEFDKGGVYINDHGRQAGFLVRGVVG